MPLYLRIAQELRGNIQTGVYKQGERLPTEENLAVRFGVNRHTLRRAVALLASDGLLRVDQGRGTFVAQTGLQSPIRYPLGLRVRFSQSLRDQGIEPGYKLLRAVAIPADRRQSEQMGLAIGEAIAHIELLGLADGRPLHVASGFFPLNRFPDIVERVQPGVQSISRLLSEAYGCDHYRKQTSVRAEIVTPEDARLLGVAYNTSALITESINVDENGNIIEYGVTRFRSDSVEMVIDADAL